MKNLLLTGLLVFGVLVCLWWIVKALVLLTTFMVVLAGRGVLVAWDSYQVHRAKHPKPQPVLAYPGAINTNAREAK